MRPRMKILFLTYNYIAPTEPGSVRAWQIGQFLASRGHQVTVVTSGTNYMTGAAGGGPAHAGGGGSGRVAVLKVASPVAAPRKSKLHRICHDTAVALLQAKTAFGLAGDHDLILSASPPILTPLFACWIAKAKGIRHVFEVRDLLSEGLRAADIIRVGPAVNLVERMERYCFRRADALVPVTPGIQRFLLSYGLPQEKMRLITNGVEDDLYETIHADGHLRRTLSIADDRFVVLFAGTLSSFSNVGVLLECAKTLSDRSPNVLFVIAGDGQYRRSYESFCLSHRLKNVLFVGSQPRARIPAFCAMADACVHLFREGPFWDIFFSNKIFDYMGAARPVVYSGGGDTADLIRKANGGIVTRGEDVAGLADAVMSLANDRAMAAELGRNGREYVLRHYSRRLLLSRYEDYLLHLKQLSDSANRSNLAVHPNTPY